MQQAIKLGKQIGAMIAGICEAELYAYAFDSLAYTIQLPARRGLIETLRDRLTGKAAEPVEDEALSLADWERAMRGIKAGGTTSCGVAVEIMRRQGQRVEQIVMITDENENSDPRFVDALRRYRRDLGADPHVVFVKTRGASGHLEAECHLARIAYDAYQFAGDYYALPNLLPLLTRPSKLDLLLDIMAYPLPQRQAA